MQLPLGLGFLFRLLLESVICGYNDTHSPKQLSCHDRPNEIGRCSKQGMNMWRDDRSKRQYPIPMSYQSERRSHGERYESIVVVQPKLLPTGSLEIGVLIEAGGNAKE